MSWEQEIRFLLSGKTQNPVIPSLTFITCNIFPEYISHIMILLSKEADINKAPLGEKSTLVTMYACLCRSWINLPVYLSHNLTERSNEPETMYFPSEEKLQTVTYSSCPSRLNNYSPVSISQILIVLSLELEIIS